MYHDRESRRNTQTFNLRGFIVAPKMVLQEDETKNHIGGNIEQCVIDHGFVLSSLKVKTAIKT